VQDIEFLRHFPFFEHLERHELEAFAPLFVTKTVDKGTYLFWENEEGDEMYLIRSGVVEIFRSDEDREIILAIFNAGDFFGEMALLGEERNRSASARTLAKTTLYAVKREHFQELLSGNMTIYFKILNAVMERLRAANEMISDLTITHARTRIARLLLRLSEKRDKSSGEVSLGMKLTHQQLANMTGTVRETVTKVLSEMQNEGLIRIVNREIIICELNRLKKTSGL